MSRGDHVTGVDGRVALHTGSDERDFAAQQRDGLALHVRTHEGAVRVVVLEEGDERGRDRHHLARRDIHVADVFGGNEVDLAALLTGENAVLGEAARRFVSGALAWATMYSSSSLAVR